MKATQLLHDLGQSLWLDNITRDLLSTGMLARYIAELSVTGLTSNPTIFDHAISKSTSYDASIREKLGKGGAGEALFFELALEDLTRAADLFRPIWDRSDGVDGWVSLEVSPLLAHDTKSTIAAAKDLFARAGRPNLFIKIPGTPEGLPAIEEAIFAGVPVNVTLLFSREHYVAAAEAFLRGIHRRIDAGLKPEVGSVASLFVSRWDAAVAGKVPDKLKNRLGIAIAKRTYRAYRRLLDSPQWQRAYNAGTRPQRLRRALRQGARGAVHRQHDAREHPEGSRRPRRAGRHPAGRRRRLRGGAGRVRERRNRRRCARVQAAGRGGQVLRGVVERSAGAHRLEEHGAQEGRLREPSWPSYPCASARRGPPSTPTVMATIAIRASGYGFARPGHVTRLGGSRDGAPRARGLP
jgi:transaldolase